MFCYSPYSTRKMQSNTTKVCRTLVTAEKPKVHRLLSFSRSPYPRLSCSQVRCENGYQRAKRLSSVTINY